MAEPDCFLRYRMRCNVEFYYVGKIPPIGIGRRRCSDPWFKMVLRSTDAATRGFTMVLFTASRRNNFVGGTWALPSALLVYTSVTYSRDEAIARFFNEIFGVYARL